MDTVRPPRPTPVDIVSADEAAAVIATTERRLAQLEQERRDAEALADQAEARTRTSTEQPLNDWTALQLERFERQLRSEHEAEMRELLAAAEQRASDCITRAHSEHDLIVSYQRALLPSPAAAWGAAQPAPAPSSGERRTPSAPVDAPPSGDPAAPPPPAPRLDEHVGASPRPPVSLAGVATRVAPAATWPKRNRQHPEGTEVESRDLPSPAPPDTDPPVPLAGPPPTPPSALQPEDPTRPGSSGRQVHDDHEPTDATNTGHSS